MKMNPLIEVLRVGLEPYGTQLSAFTTEQLEIFPMGLNSVVLVKGTKCIHLPLNPMLFCEAYAEVLNDLDECVGREHYDVDYFKWVDSTEGGFDSFWQVLFEEQGYTVCDVDGNPCITWKSNILPLNQE